MIQINTIIDKYRRRGRW